MTTMKGVFAMKKSICIILAAFLVLGLCACGGSGAGEATQPAPVEGLQVGYAKKVITPKIPKLI